MLKRRTSKSQYQNTNKVLLPPISAIPYTHPQPSNQQKNKEQQNNLLANDNVQYQLLQKVIVKKWVNQNQFIGVLKQKKCNKENVKPLICVGNKAQDVKRKSKQQDLQTQSKQKSLTITNEKPKTALSTRKDSEQQKLQNGIDLIKQNIASKSQRNTFKIRKRNSSMMENTMNKKNIKQSNEEMDCSILKQDQQKRTIQKYQNERDKQIMKRKKANNVPIYVNLIRRGSKSIQQKQLQRKMEKQDMDKQINENNQDQPSDKTDIKNNLNTLQNQNINIFAPGNEQVTQNKRYQQENDNFWQIPQCSSQILHSDSCKQSSFSKPPMIKKYSENPKKSTNTKQNVITKKQAYCRLSRPLSAYRKQYGDKKCTDKEQRNSTNTDRIPQYSNNIGSNQFQTSRSKQQKSKKKIQACKTRKINWGNSSKKVQVEIFDLALSGIYAQKVGEEGETPVQSLKQLYNQLS